MVEKSQNKIAVLLTCHNRKDKTLLSLKKLSESAVKFRRKLDIFLVDDGSHDGTDVAVKSQFPDVNIIAGSGNLFWNGGMRLAWDVASKKSYDYYLWLNDDTLIEEYALEELFDCYKRAQEKDKKPAIIVGACISSDTSGNFSYGGRSDTGPVLPNGNLQLCKYINGNIVLIPNEIFNELGNLSVDYTHSMGDIDYGLRAIKKGYKLYTTTKYVATCDLNSIPAWQDPKVPLLKRWQLLHSPKGLNIKEYNRFRQKFWGKRWILYAVKVYLKVIFPRLYNRLLMLK